MRIEVKVITNSKNTEVIPLKDSYKVRLKSKPLENLANKELINILSEYFNVSKVSVKIVRGLKSKNKLVEIESE